MNTETPRVCCPPVLITLALLLITTLGCRSTGPATASVRIATFNTALSRDTEGALHAAFARGDDAKAKLVAEVLQRTRPDVVLLQEIDYDPTGRAYADFQRNYLAVSHNGAEPIHYDYVYAPPVNTGVLAPVDLDGDGKITRPNDCYGFGKFEGQYGMVVLSRHPIDQTWIRDYRQKLWKDKTNSGVPTNYYSPTAIDHLRLSSKTHMQVPIQIAGKQYRLWISHPTPPVFDGPEDRNGRRNYDEIGYWNEVIQGDSIVIVPGSHNATRRLTEERKQSPRFVIMGDLNADPHDGESRPGAINQLLENPRINATIQPMSQGALEAARLQAGANLTHKTDPATDTADWNDTPGRGSGNLRVDYVLPSIDLNISGSGVYWPTLADPHAYLNKASDHHLVWIDVVLD